jgi:acetyl esterase/lipase
MLSWQARLLKQYFRLRRFLAPAAGVVDVQQERATTEALAARFAAHVRVQSMPVTINGVACEWLVPATVAPGVAPDRILFYLHGGSYIAGSIHAYRSLVANLATVAHAHALLIEYRLAPEAPFPAALDDALAAYRGLISNATPAQQIIVVGDSAGGGLALALLVAARDQGTPLPAAVCLSPWTDLAATGVSWVTNAKADLLNDGDKLRQAARLYLGTCAPDTPLASPLYADLHGLPPLLLQVGANEILLTDATRLAARAQAAGVPVTLKIWPGMQHEWHFAANWLPESRQAIARIGEFIEMCCAAAKATETTTRQATRQTTR